MNTQTNPPRSSWIHPSDEFGNQGPPQQWQQQQQGYGQQPQQYYQQQGPQKSGMSTGAAVALGAGAGIIGGAVIANELDDMQDDAYAEGGGFVLL